MLKVGDKVKCIDNIDRESELTLGREYEIASVSAGGNMCSVKGIDITYATNRFEKSDGTTKWVKCVTPHTDGLIKDQVYQVLKEDFDVYWIEGGFHNSFFKDRFVLVDSPHLTTSKPTASSDPTEERLWQLMRPRLNKGDCPCGGRRGVCKYHP
jgi:hypothetical protein